MNFLSKIKNFIGYHLHYAYKFTNDRSKKDLYKFYSEEIEVHNKIDGKVLIVMIDGRVKHGGIADRLRAIVSIFHFAKKKGYDFKVYHRYPFSLRDYLEPNIIDWEISEKEILYDFNSSKPIFLEALNILGETWTQTRILNTHTQDNKKQYHIYTNIDLSPKSFSSDFNILFKPSNSLISAINKQQLLIGDDYISLTFRFQQLLGDFIEGEYPVLHEKDKAELIDKCLIKVKEIYKTLAFGRTILVTSDSATFLEKVNKYPFVYIIPGEVVHMDYTNGASFDIYMKSFVDMFMISRAKQVYLLVTGKMYKSGFARRAALITNTDYKEIKF